MSVAFSLNNHHPNQCTLHFPHLYNNSRFWERNKSHAKALTLIPMGYFFSSDYSTEFRKMQHTAHFYVVTTITVTLMQPHYLPAVLCLVKRDFPHCSFGRWRQISYLFPSVQCFSYQNFKKRIFFTRKCVLRCSAMQQISE